MCLCQDISFLVTFPLAVYPQPVIYVFSMLSINFFSFRLLMVSVKHASQWNTNSKARVTSLKPTSFCYATHSHIWKMCTNLHCKQLNRKLEKWGKIFLYNIRHYFFIFPNTGRQWNPSQIVVDVMTIIRNWCLPMPVRALPLDPDHTLFRLFVSTLVPNGRFS